MPSDMRDLQEENKRLKAEIARLQFQSSKYKRLFEVSADALSILDLEQGRFIECNQSAINLHGVGSEENFLNLSPSDLSPEFQPCGNPSAVMAMEKIKKTFTEGPQIFQWTHARLDGSTFPCLVSLTALPVEEGNLVLAIGRDISELIEVQEELAKANQAKSNFLAQMSHELRTPLTTVMGFVDIILEDDRIREATKDSCEKIKFATSSLLNIINEILDMSKLESGKFNFQYGNVNLEQLLHEIVGVFASKQQNMGNVSWRLSVDPKFSEDIHCDLARMKQILFNLLGNAEKFTASGSISIQCGAIWSAYGKEFVKISVTDTGIGFADDMGDKIFDPFCQEDTTKSRQYAGTGLGLAITKKIVELLGGEIGAKGVVGQGATFWFTVPLMKAMPLESVKETKSFSDFKAAVPLSILIAEDNQVNQALLKKVLERYGHFIDVASDGRQALHAHQVKEYDVILMDVRMPVMDGIDATRTIRALECEKASIPIIGVSADAMVENMDAYYQAGMNAFSPKPYDWQHLLRTINQVLGQEIHHKV